MREDKNYYIVDKTVLPEIFLKVMEVKNLLESKKEKTVQIRNPKTFPSKALGPSFLNCILRTSLPLFTSKMQMLCSGLLYEARNRESFFSYVWICEITCVVESSRENTL